MNIWRYYKFLIVLVVLTILATLLGSAAFPTRVRAATGYTSISAGWNHTCAVTLGGGVKCWGGNGYGQLGDGTTDESHTPVDVIGLTSGISSIAAGEEHSCALTSGGVVKCWGYNSYGELGDGTTSQRLSPVNVLGLTSVVIIAIAAGYNHTCALTSGGGVKCWGQNGSGQLGNNTTTSTTMPVDVTGLTSGVKAITASESHTCALTTGGGVKCWGSNAYGRLGDGTSDERHTPVDVIGLTSGVSAISAGLIHTCAVASGGAAKCWGYNGYGELGDGSTYYSYTPVQVFGLASGVKSIAAGEEHTCALTTGGAVECWGNSSDGQLGDGSISARSTPGEVYNLTSGVISISAGSYHTCAVTASGPAKCWGHNYYGQLGDGTTDNGLIPVQVAETVYICYTLSTTSNPGSGGMVAADPLPNCTNGTQYIQGTVVHLTASPNTGYNFTNWSGSATGITNPVSLTMSAARSVTANFTLNLNTY